MKLYYVISYTFNTRYVNDFRFILTWENIVSGASSVRRSLYSCTRCAIHIYNMRYFTLCMAHNIYEMPFSSYPVKLPSFVFVLIMMQNTSLFSSSSFHTFGVHILVLARCGLGVLNKHQLSFLSTHSAAAAIIHASETNQLPFLEERIRHHLPKILLWLAAAK